MPKSSLLSELPLFLALAETGSFTAVARRTGTPRATLSRRLTRYEQALGTPLFTRTTRALRLTEAGRLLQAQGRTLAEQALHLQQAVQQVDGVPRGPLVVASQTGLGREFAAGFVSTLRQRCPQVQLRFVSSPHPLQDSLDLADVILCEGPLQDLDWVAVGLGPSDRVALASPAYLKQHGVPRTLQDLHTHALLCLAPDPHQPTLWPGRDGSEIAVNPALSSDDLNFLCECALGGVGIALLPLTAAAVPLAKGELQVVLPSLIGRKARFYVLYPSSRKNSPKIKAFLSALNAFIVSAGEDMLARHDHRTQGWHPQPSKDQGEGQPG